MDPTTTITRRDLSLTYAEFSQEVQRSKYIGLKVLPPLSVSQEAAEFQRLNTEHVDNRMEDTRRQADGTYPRDEGNFTEDSYQTTEHGVEERIDYAKVERWGDLIRIENIARNRAIWRMLRRLEYDIAQAAFSTATWTGSSLTTAVTAIGSSGNVAWTTKGSADPVAHIDFASAKVKASCGVRANKAVMSYKAYLAMLRTDRIEGLLKYDGVQILVNAMAGIVPDSMAVQQVSSSLLNVLQLEEIIVGDAAYNSADKGQTTPTFTDFWNTTRCMVCRIEDDGFEGDLQMPRPHIGRTLFCTKSGEPLPGDSMAGEDSLIIEEYEHNESRGKYIRPRNKRGIKIMHAEAGHLLTAVTA